VSITISVKFMVFWDVTLCSLVDSTNVLEKLAASIFLFYSEDGSSRFFWTLSTHKTTWCHNPDNHNPKSSHWLWLPQKSTPKVEPSHAPNLAVSRNMNVKVICIKNSPDLPSSSFSTYNRGYTLTTVTETQLTIPPAGKMEVSEMGNGPGCMWKPNLVSQRARRVELLHSFSLTSLPI
jgi:hypothetical protein